MFGENGIFLSLDQRKIDVKRRFIIPNKTGVEEDEKLLAFMDDETFFKIYSINTLQSRIKALKKEKETTQNDKIYKEIEQEIDYLYCAAFELGDVDSQHRIILPNTVIEKYNIECPSTLTLLGGQDHIKVFNNAEKAEEYIKELKKSINTF